MERFFQSMAVILIGTAVFFLWKSNNDAMFVSTVIGAVCFFLSIRFQVKERMEHREGKKNALEIKTADE